MKRRVMAMIMCVAAGVSALAVDGTWTASGVANANWNDPGNWLGGDVAGSGGIATLNVGGTLTIVNDLPGPLDLSRLDVNLAGASATYTLSLQGGTNLFTAPAVISAQTPDGRGQLSLGNAFIDGTDITFTGSAFIYHSTRANLYTGRTIISNGCLRVKEDPALGAVPPSFRADAIVLDGGTLMNDEHNVTLAPHANRGITLTANGGYLCAGYNNSAIHVAAPITGAGDLGINFQNSPVILANAGNDYAGDTVIGTTSLGSAAGAYPALLRLGANDVLPHGPGKGNLIFQSVSGYGVPRLDLNGFDATVNGLFATDNAVITTSVPGQGKLTVLSGAVFKGKLENGAMLMSGPGGMSVEGMSIPQGSVEVPLGGDVTFGGMTFYPGGTLVFAGGDAVLTNQHGFCEFSGPSVGNWAGNFAQPLTFNGWKPAAERVAEPTSATFPLNTQYSYRGMWHVPADNFYSFAGTFDDGIYLTIDGQVILNVHTFNARSVANGVYLTQGWHDIELRCSNGGGNGGKTAGWPSGIIYSPDDLDFSGNENLEFGHVFGDDGDVIAALDGINYIFGRMLMNEDGTLTISPNLLGEPVFSGIVQSPANKTLTFSGLGGDLPFGSPEPLYPAVLDGDIANALILTNHAWLCRVPSPFTVADGATLAFDGVTPPDAAAGALTLGAYSLQMLDTTLGVGAVTVNADRTLSFKSRYYDDGGFIERPSAYSTDITLNGGTVAFDNTQPIFFDGAFSGSGAILKNGAGDLTLAGTGSGCAAALHLYEGSVALSNAAALCDAPVYLAGGILRNLDNLTLNTPVSTWLGGFETPATTTFEIESQITGYGNVSKWGAGTLRLSGYDDNTDFQLHVRGGTVELGKSDGYAVGGITGIESGTTVILTGSSGNQIADDGRVQLSGGTLDLNGNSETVGTIENATWGSAIINNGPSPATLTVGAGNASASYVNASLYDGASQLALTKVGTGTLTLGPGALQYTGATTVNGGTLRLLPDDCISASLIRLTIIAHRQKPPESTEADSTSPNYWNSGFQFGEFQLLYNGVSVQWPPLDNGMTVTAPDTSTSGQTPDKVVDNAPLGSANKWYFNNSSLLPVSLIVALDQPLSFNAYRIGTGGDAPGRDPITWTLESGTVDGTTTNWVVIDAQTDYPTTTARNTYTPILPIQLPENNAIPVGMPVVVNTDGTLMLSGFTSETIEALTGDGALALDNSAVILTNPENFTGTISGRGTVTFNGSTDMITILAPGNGVTLFNNGEPATLLNDRSGTNMWGGSIQDGTAPLGLTQTAGTTYYTSTDSTYTGDTLLSGGEAIVGGNAVARYVRFTPWVLKSVSNNDYQISRFRLMLAGQEIVYPAGTTAYGEVNSGGNEPVSNTILNTDPVGNSKFYTGETRINPLVVELPYEMLIDGYTWYTANDADWRDPITWTVEVSTDKVTWTLVDSRENENVTGVRNTKVGEWRFSTLPDVFCAFSPYSLTTIETAAKLTVMGVSEPVGPLFGDGTIALDDGTLLLNTFTDAVFDGLVSGSGVLVKQGDAVQTFTGALGFSGDLIVEDGILNLDGATLTGVTNIILRGGILTGAATVSGNLTVTFEGGIYDATLNVSGTLSVDGEVLLWLPEGAPLPHKRTLFTYGSADAGTLIALRDALMATPLDPGIIVSIKTDGGTVSLTISRGGTILMIR